MDGGPEIAAKARDSPVINTILPALSVPEIFFSLRALIERCQQSAAFSKGLHNADPLLSKNNKQGDDKKYRDCDFPRHDAPTFICGKIKRRCEPSPR